MPQPALHLLLARRCNERWLHDAAPFDVQDRRAVNAFLHGSLAPDMGNFPGGNATLAQAVHTRRSGDLVRMLLRTARNQEQRAFAIGWLAHVIADTLIHPLINEAAARGQGSPTLVEHVRIEVGIDVHFCWQHPALAGVRLLPAFDSTRYGFLAHALKDTLGVAATTAQLARMERGLILFSHGALHFATSVARHLCWRDAVVPVPLASALIWHTASFLSPRDSVVNAYLNPRVPDPRLVRAVENTFDDFDTMLATHLADDAETLPNYDLEDGIVSDEDMRAA